MVNILNEFLKQDSLCGNTLYVPKSVCFLEYLKNKQEITFRQVSYEPGVSDKILNKFPEKHTYSFNKNYPHFVVSEYKINLIVLYGDVEFEHEYIKHIIVHSNFKRIGTDYQKIKS